MINPAPQSAPRFLAGQRFSWAEMLTATGQPAPRVSNWLATDALDLATETKTGRGKPRVFSYVDVQLVALFAALTDPETGLGLPLKTANAILQSAFFGNDPGAEINLGVGGRALVEQARQRLQDGFLLPAETERDPSKRVWLQAARVRFLEPDVRFWRAELRTSEGPIDVSGFPNPRREPIHAVALDALPILLSVDRALIQLRGLESFFPEMEA